jgi:leucyl aminopeptidase
MIKSVPVSLSTDALDISSLSHYDVVALPLFVGDALPAFLEPVLSAVVASDFKAAFLSHTLVYTSSGLRVLLVGLGEKKQLTEDRLRQSAGDAGRVLSGYEKPAFCVTDAMCAVLGQALVAKTVTEGVLLGTYVFDRYKSEKKPMLWAALSVWVPGASSDTVLPCIRQGETLAYATHISRNLANMPANDLTPTTFVAYAKQLFENAPVVLDVIDSEKARAMGMGSFLSVGQGSTTPSYILLMRYRPLGNDVVSLGLVGKGVTFDSGGISIKPGKGMKDMKADMTGAASVMATLWGAASLGIQKNILGIVALTENMPSGNALCPGDIVTAMNGKTIEIVNTDAEGRLILADALTLACREGASPLIDIATLTGACSVALGDLACGVLGNDQSLISVLSQVGEASGERVWQLPLYEGYLDAMKSDVADIANANETGKGGTCTAAKFLEQFIDGRPWAHVDIASMMMSGKTSGYDVKGMSGVGARLLLGYVLAVSLS